jgi:hypothetical protein
VQSYTSKAVDTTIGSMKSKAALARAYSSISGTIVVLTPLRPINF